MENKYTGGKVTPSNVVDYFDKMYEYVSKSIVTKEMKKEYDSTADTLKHIKRVNFLLLDVCKELMTRAQVHDDSKLVEPEKSGFDNAVGLSSITYGSEEYKKSLEDLQETLKHHYANNSHHPQHYKNGIEDMNLLDVIEMLMDWKAAVERHEDGDIMKSIQINKERFGISDQLTKIFINTINYLD